MKRTLLPIVLIGFVCAHAATPFMPVTQPQTEMQSLVMYTSGSAYVHGTYSPFTATVPSDYVPGAPPSMTSPGKTGPRRAFDQPGEYGQGPSPIGESWIMLLFALGTILFIAFRKHGTLTRSERDRNEITTRALREQYVEKPIDFWLRKGKAGGEPKPTETLKLPLETPPLNNQ